jgi:hypothetical protein
MMRKWYTDLFQMNSLFAFHTFICGDDSTARKRKSVSVSYELSWKDLLGLKLADTTSTINSMFTPKVQTDIGLNGGRMFESWIEIKKTAVDVDNDSEKMSGYVIIGHCNLHSATYTIRHFFYSCFDDIESFVSDTVLPGEPTNDVENWQFDLYQESFMSKIVKNKKLRVVMSYYLA